MLARTNVADRVTAGRQRIRIAIALLGLLIPAGYASAQVPNDLIDAVEYQKRNKPALIAKLQQRAVFQRQQKNVDGANETKKTADAVRANKALVLPPMGEAGNIPGTIDIEEVVEKTDGGYRIDTSLPRLEQRQGINAITGGRTNRSGSEFIYYPERTYIATTRALKKGERINVRRTQDGFAEIPAEELEQAAKLLKNK